ncbi:hypothetical protein T439DRAFT_45192 [Meredithblackwellia eburnea MCA 4105]
MLLADGLERLSEGDQVLQHEEVAKGKEAQFDVLAADRTNGFILLQPIEVSTGFHALAVISKEHISTTTHILNLPVGSDERTRLRDLYGRLERWARRKFEAILAHHFAYIGSIPPYRVGVHSGFAFSIQDIHIHFITEPLPATSKKDLSFFRKLYTPIELNTWSPGFIKEQSSPDDWSQIAKWLQYDFVRLSFPQSDAKILIDQGIKLYMKRWTFFLPITDFFDLCDRNQRLVTLPARFFRVQVAQDIESGNEVDAKKAERGTWTLVGKDAVEMALFVVPAFGPEE